MSELPGGTVTFCFTDIEGSTRLFQRLGPGFADVLAAHNAALRRSFERHGGVEVKTEGDAFFVAFADAASAVAACVDGQRALRAERWPDGVELRVRMGLHTGEGYPVEGDYVALAVHQAARVVDAGHGGQILLSAATAAEVDGRLPQTIELTALGPHLLKDFDEAEPLFQVGADDLEDAFPALRVPPAARHNVPRFTTSFVGRQRELREVRKLVDQLPLVTLLGTGGTGKTRLAFEVARDQAATWPDGARAVLLAGLADEADVAQAVADAVGARVGPGQEATDAVLAHLADRQLLLVLDNCEHVVDQTRELVRAVVQRAPGIHILVTSRRPIGLEDEHVVPLAPLDVETDAVALLVDRARRVRPSFDPHVDTVALEAICRAVDGLPLAVELAAARLRSMSPAEVATRLDDALGLLRSRDGGSEPRQATVRGLIEWSTRLLTPEETAVFRRAAVFRGGFTLAAAEDVLAGGDVDREDVLDLVTALVDHSLLLATDGAGGTRHRMLVLVQAAAMAELQASGEEEDVRRRHLEWAAGLEPDDDTEEWDNVVAALEHGLATDAGNHVARLFRTWLSRWMAAARPTSILLDWVERALGLPLEPAARHAVAVNAFRLAFDLSDWERARRYLDECRSSEAGSDEIVLLIEAELCAAGGDLAGAEEAARRVLDLSDRPYHLVNAGNILGAVAFYRQDWEAAKAHYERALATDPDTELRSMLLSNLAEVAVCSGQPDAEGVARQAVARAESDGQHVREAAARCLLAARLATHGDIGEAREQARRAIEAFAAGEVTANTIDALGLLARIELLAGDRPAAISAARRAMTLAQRHRVQSIQGALLAAARCVEAAGDGRFQRLLDAAAGASTPAQSVPYDLVVGRPLIEGTLGPAPEGHLDIDGAVTLALEVL